MLVTCDGREQRARLRHVVQAISEERLGAAWYRIDSRDPSTPPRSLLSLGVAQEDRGWGALARVAHLGNSLLLLAIM